MLRPASWPLLVRAGLFALAYFGAAVGGDMITLRPHNYVAFWPPAGLYLAVLLLTTPRQWPVFLLAALAANFAFDMGLQGKRWPTALGFWTANTVAATLAAWLRWRWVKVPPRLDLLLDMQGLVVVGAVFATAIGATIGTYTLVLSFNATFSKEWFPWWVSSILGVLAVTPPVLALAGLSTTTEIPWTSKRIVETVALAIGLLSIVVLVDSSLIPGWAIRPYLCFPFLLWLALRYDPPSMALVLLAFAVGVLTIVVGGWFAYHRLKTTPLRVFQLQLFISVTAGVFLVLTAALAQLRATERDLREQQTVLTSFFEGASFLMGVVEILDDDILHLSDNVATARLFGTTPEGMRNRRASELGVPRAHILEWLDRYRECESRQKPVRFEYQHPFAAESRWLSATVTFIARMPNGRSRFSYLVEDVTDRKRAEDLLRANETRLRFFLKHTPAAVAMFDKEMRYLVWSDRWLTDYGLGERDLAGLTHYEVFPEITEPWKEVHRRCLAGAVERCAEDAFPRTDGHLDYIRWEIFPWLDDANAIGGIIMFTEVITRQKRAEDERRNLETKVQHQTS